MVKVERGCRCDVREDEWIREMTGMRLTKWSRKLSTDWVIMFWLSNRRSSSMSIITVTESNPNNCLELLFPLCSISQTVIFMYCATSNAASMTHLMLIRCSNMFDMRQLHRCHRQHFSFVSSSSWIPGQGWCRSEVLYDNRVDCLPHSQNMEHFHYDVSNSQWLNIELFDTFRTLHFAQYYNMWIHLWHVGRDYEFSGRRR